MEIAVLRAGAFSTVQDAGRRGYRASGVPLGGAADPFALRVANFLVGNPEDAAGLEIVLDGPDLYFPEACTVAVGGAEFAGVPAWRPWTVPGGTRVLFGQCLRGYYAYLAVRGGIAAEPVLGSRSTYVRGGWGGWDGRAIREGDRLPVGLPADGARADPAPSLFVAPSILPRLFGIARRPRDRRRAGGGTRPAHGRPLQGLAEIRPDGPAPAGSADPPAPAAANCARRAVGPGSVQVPPDGQPIVLLAEAQTLGGYPLAAHVISVDLPLVAQLRPGQTLRFQEIELAEAQHLLVAPGARPGAPALGAAQPLGRRPMSGPGLPSTSTRIWARARPAERGADRPRHLRQHRLRRPRGRRRIDAGRRGGGAGGRRGGRRPSGLRRPGRLWAPGAAAVSGRRPRP